MAHLQFSGWEVVDDGASFPGVMLGPSQTPQNRGVYTMYHGTRVSSARLIIANGFKQSAGGTLGQGVYVSRDKKKADGYPALCSPSDRVVLELRVRVGRVKRIDQLGHPLQISWHAQGYDTAWLPPTFGLEEDCVFDPKRVKVVGIANAPSTAIQTELQQLLAKTPKSPRRGGAAAADVCSLCKRKTQQGSQHIKQHCWKCGQNICILMSKHFCAVKP
uniref:Grass carp reovirus (GCRV)-induced gene 2p n=1 Tax=Acanthochromis polyacanthus TaxID=80966 RepID=A0A3Q1F106_9TELE